MVGEIGEDPAGLLEAVTEGWAGVRDQVGGDLDPVDVKRARWDVVKATFDRSRTRRGKSGGERYRLSRSFRVCVVEIGPQTSTRMSGSCNGAKNGSPWMWSMCRCVMRTSTCSTDSTFAPSARIPLPASRTRSLPSFPNTSTADVSPPYLAVSNPALAIDPLVPHSRALSPRPPRRWRVRRGISRPGPRSAEQSPRPPATLRPFPGSGRLDGRASSC